MLVKVCMFSVRLTFVIRTLTCDCVRAQICGSARCMLLVVVWLTASHFRLNPPSRISGGEVVGFCVGAPLMGALL